MEADPSGAQVMVSNYFSIKHGHYLYFIQPDYDDSVEFQTFSLNCNGAAGDMIYITDTEAGNVGHGISEVFVIESRHPMRGKLRVTENRCNGFINMIS